jgi:uncharacterized glyoxalase superfamily protein PhnB
MKKKTPAVPAGRHTLIPTLTMKDAKKAIEFYERAFGAKATSEPFLMPDGRVGHAELKVGDSYFMLADEFPDFGALAPDGKKSSHGMFLYVDDCDAVLKRALDAGARTLMPIGDQFWGDRMGQIQDPFGHRWSIATHKEDLTDAQIKERARAVFSGAK